MTTAASIVRCHHEMWDGAGYPEGLKAEQIPLPARVFQVVDAFDAMTTDRPYRASLGVEKAAEEIQRMAGTQFDPDVSTRRLLSTPCLSVPGPGACSVPGFHPLAMVAHSLRWRDLGEFIRDQRRVGTCRCASSEMAGISNPYLSQIERGLRKPSAEILQQIAKAAAHLRRRPSTSGPASSRSEGHRADLDRRSAATPTSTRIRRRP